MKYFIVAFILSGISYQIQAQELSKKDLLNSWESPAIRSSVEQPSLKNKNFATALSVGASVGTIYFFRYVSQHHLYNPQAIGTAFAMAFLAPGTGYLYTGNVDDFLLHALYRVGGFSAFYLGGIIITESEGSIFELSLENPIWGFMISTIGAGIMLDSIWKDFTGVRKKVDEYNQNLMNRVQISPVINPLTKTVGVGLRVSL